MKTSNLKSFVMTSSMAALVLLSACVYGQTSDPSVSHGSVITSRVITTPKISMVKHPELFAEARQHLGLSIVLASHFCEQKRWPASIAAAKQYQHSRRLSLPVGMAWSKFRGTSVGGQFKTQSLSSNGQKTITSIHSQPACSPKEIRVNMRVVIR